MPHPGDYLAARQGIGRQCWDGCDKTPCACPREVRRMTRRGDRARVRREVIKDAQE